MTPWYAPENMNVWRRRMISLRTMALLLLMAVLLVTELRFSWCEILVGQYLATTNAYRPKSGTIWEQDRQADSARQTLAQYADQRQSVMREARQADTLGQAIANIVPGKGVMISADHFLGLYLKLQPVLSHEIVSPYTLLTYTCSGQWQRTFIERQDQQVLIFMLDAQNQVIFRLSIGPVLLGHIEQGEVAIRTGLDQLSDFAGNIYPAQRFFEVLNTYPRQIRQGIVANPEDLLRINGRIRRIGISEVDLGDSVDLGLEVEDAEGLKVILIQAGRSEVRQLQQALGGDASFRWPWAGEGGKP